MEFAILVAIWMSKIGSDITIKNNIGGKNIGNITFSNY